MNKSQQKISAWQKSIGKTLKGLGAILGGIAIGELIKDSIRAAMDVQGSMLQIRRTMGANATVFENWAQTQAKAYGMAREEAYKYGATYSNLISSFVQDTQETTRYTIELLQASSVVAEKTGRNVEDVMERIRSGLLGNTEAIEDLGIHVNIAMLESTEAFRLFARGRSWKQLTFQEQQQIRLLSILEQAYVKYGDTLAGTVHTKQLMFIATLKNIRLNLGQAFLPVYNTVLPVLTDLASKIEANKGTLLRWGQTAANVAGFIVRGISWVTKAFIKNWGAIRFAATALLTFAVASKAINVAGVAVRSLTLFLWALRGHAFSTSGVFGVLATSVRTYQAASIGAAGTTNIFTGALATLRGALYAVHTALGPVGWILIGLSLLVAGGLHLWNKYTQSLQKTPKLSNKVEDSTSAVNKAINDQAEALKAAGKAAAKNLQPFDEINQLQEEMATGTDYLDAIGDALEGIEGGISMPPIDFDEFLEGLEDVKPTFRGFLAWIWDEWTSTVQSWDWVQSLSGWIVDTFFDEATGKWSLSKAWGKWETWVQEWSKPFSDWVVDIIISLNNVKQNFATKFKEIKDSVLTRFSEIKSNLATRWSEIKTNTLTKISEIKTGISTKFNEIKNNISTKINEVKTKLSGTWNSIKISAGSAWDGIKNSIRGAINSIIGYINKFIKGFNKIKIEIPSVTLPFYGKVGGWSLKLPQISEIPTLAKGGLIADPTLAMLGEAGKEAVLPLERNTGWIDMLANSIASAVGSAVLQATQFAGGGSSRDAERELVIEMDGIKVARVLLPKLDREAQRMGMAILKPV
jgi:hypothetical protein